jgi:hypothetical protein
MTTGQLFVRIGGTETREIPDPGFFVTADPSATKVLLNNGHIYDLETNSVVDLTGGLGGFEGILGAADNLSHVYFVDNEVLTASETNDNGEAAEAGAHNLYAWDAGGTVFVGRLLSRDNLIGAPERIGAWKPSPSQRTAQVTPDGRYLAFMSAASLTGYDNARRNGGPCTGSAGRCYQVYEYDAVTGELACASCNPSGEKPLDYSHLSLIDPAGGSAIFPQPKNLTAGGRLFFESQDTLSAQDVNGSVQDVYQWEPPGSAEGPSNDTCARSGGCVSLISSGHSPNDSYFLNATPSGSDAFIVTREQLLPQDRDDFTDVYDARIGGGGFAADGVAPCSGEACRGPIGAPPSVGAPGSSSFAGPGNQPSGKHRKHRVRRKGHGKKRGHKYFRGVAK